MVSNAIGHVSHTTSRRVQLGRKNLVITEQYEEENNY
jgi:hypothetical protein